MLKMMKIFKQHNKSCRSNLQPFGFEGAILNKFKRTSLGIGLIFSLLLSLNGCVYLVIGGIGALGGYVVSPDTVEGRTEHCFSETLDASVEIVSIIGEITNKAEESGLIEAKAGKTKLTVTVVAITDDATRVIVKARKSFFPKIRTAQDVYVKIMSYLNE